MIENRVMNNGFPIYVIECTTAKFAMKYLLQLYRLWEHQNSIYSKFYHIIRCIKKIESRNYNIISFICYPKLSRKVVYDNFDKIANFFNQKQRMSLNLHLHIINKYTCDVCYDTYIGLLKQSTSEYRNTWKSHTEQTSHSGRERISLLCWSLRPSHFLHILT